MPLHLRFYFTLFASLLLFAVIGVWVWHIADVGPIGPKAHMLLVLPAVAIVLSVVAYPISRRLTQRLEHLERAVDALGAGDLSTRVAIEGSDEVARLAARFNAAAARIEALVGAHKTLLANASHELRTPLARIRLATELMKAAADPHRKAGLDQDIAELDRLIDEILLASRLDALVELDADEELDLLGLAAEECARYDEAHLEGVPVLTRGDPRLLRRLLRNLLENAERHGRPPIAVRVAPSAEHAEIRVRDAGPTIPPEHAAHLFEPFYRRPDAIDRAGAGLGLALVRQIAERHGGSVDYASDANGDHGFLVRLPLRRGPAP